MMRRSWCCFAASALAAGGAGAATVLDKQVEVTIDAAGTVREEVRLTVVVDGPADAGRWSPYVIPLDDNRELTAVAASVLAPDGRRTAVGEDRQDTHEWAGEGTVHTSARLHLVEFPPAAAGSRLSLRYRTETRPYFPGGLLALSEIDGVDRLSVSVGAEVPGWRWALDGPAEELEVLATDGELRLLGSLPGHEDDGSDTAVLRFAWGPARDWTDVGAWYGELLASLPRSPTSVRTEAQRLVRDLDDPRSRAEALLAFVRGAVRYVAVEVGIGGYRPSPPEEVLARRWGDCKDKSFLLIDLLAEAGIEAHPALIRADRRAGIREDFPSPFDFNHLIVAVPSAVFAVGEGDPAAGGYLFVDPTLPRGGLAWLHPWTQGQRALVVRGEGGELVATPLLPGLASSRLEADLRVVESGDVAGVVRSTLVGAAADALIERARAVGAEKAAREALAALLPGFSLAGLTWGEDAATGAPTVTVGADVRRERWVEGGAGGTVRVPGPAATPGPAALDGDEAAVIAARAEARWRVELPADWCRPAAVETGVDTTVGSFTQHLRPTARGFEIDRSAELRARFLEGAPLGEAYRLALLEHRSLQRRVRLGCGDG